MFAKLRILLILWFAATATTATHSVTRANPKTGGWFSSLTTMFTDSEGAAGVRLNQYPYQMRMKSAGKRKVFPVAVHTKDVSRYKYKILEIRSGSRRVFAHVVDECAAGDCDTNYSKARNAGATLLDLHKSMWGPLGLSKMDMHKMKARVVAYVPPKRGRGQMAPVLTADGKRGYVPNNWKV